MSRETLERLSIPDQVAIACNLAKVGSQFALSMQETLEFLRMADLRADELATLKHHLHLISANVYGCKCCLDAIERWKNA